MRSNTGDPFHPSAGNGGGAEGHEAEVADLLEEAWFFGNLLRRNRRLMTRCFSDPCPYSLDYNSGISSVPEKKPNRESSQAVPPRTPDKTCPPVDKNLNRRRSSKKLIQNCSSSSSYSSSSYDDQSGHFHSPSSTEKTISEVWQDAVQGKVSDGKESGSRRRSPRPFLLRTPSLPPCIGRQELGIEERLQTNSHPRMSKSNRQSSLNISSLLPHQYDPKVLLTYAEHLLCRVFSTQ